MKSIYLIMLTILMVNNAKASISIKFYCYSFEIPIEGKNVEKVFSEISEYDIIDKINKVESSDLINQLRDDLIELSSTYNIKNWFYLELISKLGENISLSEEDKTVLYYILSRDKLFFCGIYKHKEKSELVYQLIENDKYRVYLKDEIIEKLSDKFISHSAENKELSFIEFPKIPCQEIIQTSSFDYYNNEFKWSGNNLAKSYCENHPNLPIQYYSKLELSNIFEYSVLQHLFIDKDREIESLKKLAEFISSSIQLTRKSNNEINNQSLEGALLSYFVNKPTLYLSFYEMILNVSNFDVFLLNTDDNDFSVVVNIATKNKSYGQYIEFKLSGWGTYELYNTTIPINDIILKRTSN